MFNIAYSKTKSGIAAVALLGISLGLMAIVLVFSQNVQASVPTDKIDQALSRLSKLSGQTFTSKDQAAAWCDTTDINKLIKCETVGKEFGAYNVDQRKLVDAFLGEVEAIGDEIKNCQTPECFLATAKTLSDKLSVKAPDVATKLDLTKQDIQDEEKVAEIIKNEDVDQQQCQQLDSETETTDADTLKKCYAVAQKLSKDKKLSKYLPAETDNIQGHTDKKVALSEGLANGSVSCSGNTTLEACGNYCLNISQESGQDASVIPQDCRDIAQSFFGLDGVKQLELAHSQVKQTQDFYAKKGQDLVFTTETGDTLTDPKLIGQHCEQAGQAGNEAEASKCMEFFGKHFQLSDSDKKQTLDLVRHVNEQGGNLDLNGCAKDPTASEQCQKFLPPEQQDLAQVDKIMRDSLGFDPRECQHRNCVDGSAKALDKLKALNSTNPQVQEIISHLEQNINQAKKFAEVQNRPELRQSIEKAKQECSGPNLTPEQVAGCIAKAAKFHIIDSSQAVQKIQQYNQDFTQSFQHGPDETGPNQQNQATDQFNGSSKNFRPTNFTGPNFGGGVSPECFKAIQSGDFIAAKTVCTISTPPPQPIPSRGICPASPYFECPINQHHNDYHNSNGCIISNCVPNGMPYPSMDPATGCVKYGGTWNGTTCIMPSTTPPPGTSYTPYPTPPPASGTPYPSPSPKPTSFLYNTLSLILNAFSGIFR